ncbi:MAG: ATP12 family protein [Paracoccus sp. (in: a-proteobacteria)]|nr:ATP12 family protein [Paracoccus sp. (in: a-proteobacteria)]
MSEWKPRKFWTKARAEAEDGGFTVLLDARRLMTPGKQPLTLPTRALADAIAAEWDAQAELIEPETMPLTRAANSAIEKVAPQFDAVADMLAAYGGTDLLCYRASAPADLVRRQAEAWDEWLAWARRDLGADLRVTEGVIPIAQNPGALQRLRAELGRLDVFGLTALHDLVTLPGSLILGLAVLRGHLDAGAAFDLSRVDEDYQAEQWGRDAEAEASARAKRAAMESAARLWALSRPPQTP